MMMVTSIWFKTTTLILLIFLSFNVSASITHKNDVTHHYVILAHTMFTDTYQAALALSESIDIFLSNPTKKTHKAAKSAWVIAHTTYSQTEVFRFGNPNVDEWEGKVNAWPMDEGLIDYVHSEYNYENGNPHANENIIAGNVEIDIELVQKFHEKAGSEANVASGYHAIEFLLWGQDLNKNKSDSGSRAYTDYLQTESCTNNHCERRSQYLKTVVELLVHDLREMMLQWHPQSGSYTKTFHQLPLKEQLSRILLGIGGLSYGELAAERIRVALIANSQEDEQSCFSDTTDIAIVSNALAIRNIYLGQYTTLDGTLLSGPSLSDLVAQFNEQLNQELIQQLETSLATANEISRFARMGQPFDQQILPDNAQDRARLENLINQLRHQTQSIENAAEFVLANS